MPELLDSYCTFYLEYPGCQNLLRIKKNVESKKQKKHVDYFMRLQLLNKGQYPVNLEAVINS